jgi:acyl carrier protein
VLWIKFITFFRNIIWPNSAKSAETSGSSEESSPEDAVIKAVAAVTGVDERVSLDDSFDEIGLVSVGLPVLVGIINAGEQFAVISAQEIATCANLRDVVRIIASKRESARSSVGFGTRSSL